MATLKQFDCTVCGHMEDIMTGDTPPICPFCDGPQMKQVITFTPRYVNRKSPMNPTRDRGMRGSHPEVTMSEQARIDRQTELREKFMEGCLDE